MIIFFYFFFCFEFFYEKIFKKSILFYLLTAEEMFITDFYGICCIYMYACVTWTMIM